MSGGAWEYVAGYVNNGNSSLTSYGSSLVNSTDAKTKNVYSVGGSDSQSNNYNANAGVYGDAVYETSSGTYNGSGTSTNQSWYGDYSNFPYSSAPFFIRGGIFNDGSDAGVFFFNNNGGTASSDRSFRLVLVAL